MDSWVWILVQLGASAVLADYDCLCNYDVERSVFSQADAQSSPIGYLYEFDCKQIVPGGTGSWLTIAFEHQIGFVQKGGQQEQQICPGDPSASDIVTTKAAATTTTTTTTASTTSTTTTTTTTTPTTPTTTQPTTTTPTTTVSTTTTTSTTTQPPTTTRLITLPHISPVRLTSSTPKPVIGDISLCPAKLHQYTREDGGALTQYGNYCYELVPIRAIWSRAESDCMAKGGDLFHIDDQGLQDFIYRWIKSYNFDHAVWTGLHDVRFEEHFEWISGDHVVYTHFHPDRKGNLASHYDEDCVLFVPYAPYFGQWDDVICGSFGLFGDVGQQNPFICEYALHPHNNPLIVG